MKPKRDIYFQKALEEGYLARSAYKLLQIDEVFDIFKDVTRAIDLCSAPGSWTQVIYNKLHGVVNNYDPSKVNPNVKIVSVDMMPMDHLPGVVHLQADISQYSTMKNIIDEFQGEKSDIVVCDGAIDVVGMNLLDYYMHHRIFLSALYIVLNTLRTGGIFVVKIFIDKGHEIFVKKLNIFFQNVCVVKPDCSRNKEAFAVCQDYIPLPGFDPIQLTSYVELKSNDFSELKGINAELIPYLCVDSYLPNNFCTTKNNFSTSKAAQDLYDMIDCVFKDNKIDKTILIQRILRKPLVYQITEDNHLVYDTETENFLFKGFSKDEDTIKAESIFGVHSEVDPKYSNSELILRDNLNNKDLQGEQQKINRILGEKIKEIELQNKGKFSGLGFDLEDWKFFARTMDNCDNDYISNLESESIYKDFEAVNKEFEYGPKTKTTKYIKSLFMKQEELKNRIRNHTKNHELNFGDCGG